MILNNAELRRNIWLDFTPQRMLFAFVIIFLIYYVLDIAFTLTCFFIFIWGTKAASESVIEEVNQHTWDFQRQSPMTPLEMSIGKLFGSTAFAWFCGGISLALYCYQSTQEPSLIGQFFRRIFADRFINISLVDEILLLVIGGIFTQAIALILSLQVLSKNRYNKDIKSFRYFLIALIIGGTLSYQMFLYSKLISTEFKWYQLNFNIASFAFFSLCLFLTWSLVGIYRSFSKELQYRHIPWVWLLFNAFCLAYMMGFVSIEQIELKNMTVSRVDDLNNVIKSAPAFMALFMAIVLGYAAILSDNLSFMQYKRCLVNITSNKIYEGLTYLPLWAISYCFMLLSAFFALSQHIPLHEIDPSYSTAALILTTLGLVTRDFILLHYLSMRRQTGILGTFLMYLLLLYFLFPLALKILGLGHFNVAFYPSLGGSNLTAMCGILLQIFVIGLALGREVTRSRLKNT